MIPISLSGLIRNIAESSSSVQRHSTFYGAVKKSNPSLFTGLSSSARIEIILLFHRSPISTQERRCMRDYSKQLRRAAQQRRPFRRWSAYNSMQQKQPPLLSTAAAAAATRTQRRICKDRLPWQPLSDCRRSRHLAFILYTLRYTYIDMYTRMCTFWQWTEFAYTQNSLNVNLCWSLSLVKTLSQNHCINISTAVMDKRTVVQLWTVAYCYICRGQLKNSIEDLCIWRRKILLIKSFLNK